MAFTDAQIKKMTEHVNNVDIAEAQKLLALGWEAPDLGADPAEIAQSYAELIRFRQQLSRQTKTPQTPAAPGELDLQRDLYKQRLDERMKNRSEPLKLDSAPAIPAQPAQTKSPADLQAKLDKLNRELYGHESEKALPLGRRTSVFSRIKHLTKQLREPLSNSDRTAKEGELKELRSRRTTLERELAVVKADLEGAASAPRPSALPAPQSAPAAPTGPMPAVTAPTPGKSQLAAPPPAPAAPPDQRPTVKPLSERKTLPGKTYPMADSKVAIKALEAVVAAVDANPAYANTYPIFESVLQRVINDNSNMYLMVPKIRGAFEYMSQRHPRLYKQIGNLMIDIERGISPPQTQKKKDVFQQLREFLDPEEPEAFEQPERVFRSSKTYSVDAMVEAISGYISELEDSNYPDTDIKIAVLRQFGPGLYNSIYDDKVSTSGTGVDADNMARLSWHLAPTKINSIDKTGNIHATVTVSNLSRDVIIPETIEYHSILGD